MRTYGQYCSIARALDVVGDRWTLLIVRELLLQGPCRFTDLKNGLPGIAANLLSGRLKELEEAGLMLRRDAPPPVATALFELTAGGRALEPVLKEIARWGLAQMIDERADDTFRAEWLAYVPAWFTTDTEPAGPPAVIQLIASGQHAVIELGDGSIRSRPGRADNPDLVAEGSARAILGLLTGVIDRATATGLGLTVKGRQELLDRLRPISPERG